MPQKLPSQRGFSFEGAGLQPRRQSIPIKAASAAEGMLSCAPRTFASHSRAFAFASEIGLDFSPDIETQPQNGPPPLIAVLEEDGLTPVSALHHVVRQSGHYDARLGLYPKIYDGEYVSCPCISRSYYSDLHCQNAAVRYAREDMLGLCPRSPERRPMRDDPGPDRSMADFTWCMTAIDWGFSIEEAAAKLPEVGEKARERVRLDDEGYALITAQNAAAAVERNVLKRDRAKISV